MKPKNNSPYSAGLCGCTFMFYEFNRLLPLFLAPNSEELIRQEIKENKVFMVNSEVSRARYMAELKKRFQSVPLDFWIKYQDLSEDAQRLAMFYVMMKTYRIVLDFHLNVALRKWNSIDQHLTADELATEFSEIAANDEFVDSWSDITRKRVVSAYLASIKQAGLMDKTTGALHQANLTPEEYAFYLKIGQDWFLEACFLRPYEIESIKPLAL